MTTQCISCFSGDDRILLRISLAQEISKVYLLEKTKDGKTLGFFFKKRIDIFFSSMIFKKKKKKWPFRIIGEIYFNIY